MPVSPLAGQPIISTHRGERRHSPATVKAMRQAGTIAYVGRNKQGTEVYVPTMADHYQWRPTYEAGSNNLGYVTLQATRVRVRA